MSRDRIRLANFEQAEIPVRLVYIRVLQQLEETNEYLFAGPQVMENRYFALLWAHWSM